MLHGLDLLRVLPEEGTGRVWEEMGHQWWLDDRTGSDIDLIAEQVVLGAQGLRTSSTEGGRFRHRPGIGPQLGPHAVVAQARRFACSRPLISLRVPALPGGIRVQAPALARAGGPSPGGCIRVTRRTEAGARANPEESRWTQV